MATRAYAVDEVLSQGGQGGTRDRQSSGRRIAARGARAGLGGDLFRDGHQPCGCRVRSSTMLSAGPQHRIGASFVTAPLSAEMEVTGPIKLVLWVSGAQKDMDIFATIRDVGPDGKDVWEVGQQGQRCPSRKAGCARRVASSIRRSRCRICPYHAHDERWWLKPGRGRSRCEIEIWPACMVFGKGASHPPRHPAARRCRQRALPALSGGVQHGRHEYGTHWRGPGILSAAAGHSAASMTG